jgi:hypothetical protein
MQQLFSLPVPFDVFKQLEAPKSAIGLRNRRAAAAAVLMPEAAVDEDRLPYIVENYVGRARKFLHMESVLVSAGTKETSGDHLGSRVAAPNAAHHPASFCSREYVGHEFSWFEESTGGFQNMVSPSPSGGSIIHSYFLRHA